MMSLPAQHTVYFSTAIDFNPCGQAKTWSAPTVYGIHKAVYSHYPTNAKKKKKASKIVS